MPTKPRPWPVNAEWARYDSVTRAEEIAWMAWEIIDRHHAEIPNSILRDLAEIQRKAHEISDKLEKVKGES